MFLEKHAVKAKAKHVEILDLRNHADPINLFQFGLKSSTNTQQL
jgi:hypothetical protein